MNIKTFPLQFTEEFHAELTKQAQDENKPLKTWIMEAIQEKLNNAKSEK